MTVRALATLLSFALCGVQVGCRSVGTPEGGGPDPAGASALATPTVGLLVMAHGGTAEWDRAVEDALAPLRTRIPTALALGMADPATLRAAVDSLESRGVTEIAVVRLFLSGSSFLHRTEYLFGLRGDAPVRGADEGRPHGEAHGIGLASLRPRPRIFLSREGLSEAPMVPAVLAERARAAAPHADRPVLLLAHGMGGEEENRILLEHMRRSAAAVAALGFPEVKVATLREDWPEARRGSEEEIRRWAAAVGDPARPLLVLPYRLFGFGPYAEVLAGIAYEEAPGLLPHPLVTSWIEDQTTALLCRHGSRSPLGPCSNPDASGG